MEGVRFSGPFRNNRHRQFTSDSRIVHRDRGRIEGDIEEKARAPDPKTKLPDERTFVCLGDANRA